ncbi:hypothetical protein WAI453_007526 [Rhynchosporium graminicola]
MLVIRSVTVADQPPEVNKCLGPGEFKAECVYASFSLPRSKYGHQIYNFDHTTVMYVRCNKDADGSAPNQSIVGMMKGVYQQENHWKGLIVIVSRPGTLINPLVYKDVTATTFRVTIDFFKAINSGLDSPGLKVPTTEAATDHLVPHSNMVQGVEIASKGDAFLHGKMRYTEVQVSFDNPIFTISPTQISEHMGFPLQVRNAGDFRRRDVEKGDKMGFNTFKNRSALFLNMEADIQGHNWGWADIFVWDQDIGTVLVVRQDKRLLTSPQVEALAK